MIYKNVKYLLTTHSVDLMPQDDLEEIAIVGKSNVGKSSFINLVSNNKKMAYISSKPGKTRALSFFLIDNKFRIVDLPGYGFANVSRNQTQIFAEMMETFFAKRKNLKLVIVLVDIRRSFCEEDLDMIKFLTIKEIDFKFIGTKVDKATQSEIFKFNSDSHKFFSITPLMISVRTKKNTNLIADFINF